MALGRPAAALICAAAFAACAQTTVHPVHPSADDARTTSPPATPSTVTPPSFGVRSFTVSGLVLSGSTWLTIALSPTDLPVQLQASGGGTVLEVCPAGLDGGLQDNSWPASTGFTKCTALGPTGNTALPATSGGRVAFAVRPVSAQAPARPATITVAYGATDSSVSLIPPAGHAALTASYAPTTATTAAVATPINGFVLAPNYSVDVTQGGRRLALSLPCDFHTALPLCHGVAVPGQPVQARLVGQAGPVALNLAWK